jgi:hypothetical protein
MAKIPDQIVIEAHRDFIELLQTKIAHQVDHVLTCHAGTGKGKIEVCRSHNLDLMLR